EREMGVGRVRACARWRSRRSGRHRRGRGRRILRRLQTGVHRARSARTEKAAPEPRDRGGLKSRQQIDSTSSWGNHAASTAARRSSKSYWERGIRVANATARYEAVLEHWSVPPNWALPHRSSMALSCITPALTDAFLA